MSLLVKGFQEYRDGFISISGSKNSALPIMLASMLVQGTTVLKNLPITIQDLKAACQILEFYGLQLEIFDNSVKIINNNVRNLILPQYLSKKLRISSLLIGILLRLFGNAVIPMPGGCRIGKERPLDIHYKGFLKFGVKSTQDLDVITATVEHERYTTYKMRFPSVGATENLILFSVLSGGDRVITNCAREPEVQDLVNFLNACGASIEGSGTNELKIRGVKHLHPIEWEVISDRIEIGTFAFLAAIIERNVTLSPVKIEHINSLLCVLHRIGINYSYEKNTKQLHITASKFLNPIEISTNPYPGFPTDLQPCLTALCLKANGISLIQEKVYHDRFSHLPELLKMGARVKRAGNSIQIYNSTQVMYGAHVSCPDIRAGVSLILAALLCKGISRITNELQIERGYDSFYEKLHVLNIHMDRIMD